MRLSPSRLLRVGFCCDDVAAVRSVQFLVRRTVCRPVGTSQTVSKMQAKAAHRSLGEGGPLCLQKSYGWQAPLRSPVRRRVPTVARSAKVGCRWPACPECLQTAARVQARTVVRRAIGSRLPLPPDSVHVALRRRRESDAARAQMARPQLPCRRAACARHHPSIPPTTAVSVIGPATLTVVPAAFCSVTLLNVTVARRRSGERARIPGGDSSMVTVPATARHLSGSVDSAPFGMTTSEQKWN